MSKAVLQALIGKFAQAVVHSHSEFGDDTAVVTRERLVDIARYLKEEHEFAMPLDVTAVDYSTYPEPRPCPTRFEVVYHLRSLSRGARIRLKVRVPEDDAEVPSLTAVWRGVTWFERETFDMLGIRFAGHPDLRRILLYPEFQGHPLHKDYPVRGYQPLMAMPTLDGDPLPTTETEEPS